MQLAASASTPWLSVAAGCPGLVQAFSPASSPSCCSTPQQTVFLHVDPTDTVSMLKQKLQELLQKVGR